ncbi:MAG: antibiotic biosynthesis monooxygenase [Flavobacterium sp. BFFFF2]|nr:MAG: antibiotic biosynthesis monooxygenase [Flavobacterium sp. BFFFF2]
MLIRIVKLKFHEHFVSDFLENFHAHKAQIRAFPGNQRLELYQDLTDPTCFFTYSYWDHEAALDSYRQSDLFINVWTYTKTMFSDKPFAWSVHRLEKLD